ncbi:MAG: hypothetical protein IJN54_01930 [Lachnospiraceae bacterium]|nr:hypothetical protein [Lachnospiraceae bacterium]
MNRETLIQNVIQNYGQYGITKEDIEPLINESEKDGLSYELIYFNLQLALADCLELKYFLCTARQMARAFGVSDDRMLEIIKEISNELMVKENGLDDYIKIPVEIGEKFLHQSRE